MNNLIKLIATAKADLITEVSYGIMPKQPLVSNPIILVDSMGGLIR